MPFKCYFQCKTRPYRNILGNRNVLANYRNSLALNSISRVNDRRTHIVLPLLQAIPQSPVSIQIHCPNNLSMGASIEQEVASNAIECIRDHQNNKPIYHVQNINKSPIRRQKKNPFTGYNSGRWSQVECAKFLYYMQDLEFKDWKGIARKIQTRSYIQVKSHAQKLFEKWLRGSYAYETLFDSDDTKNLFSKEKFRQCEQSLAAAYILYKFRE